MSIYIMTVGELAKKRGESVGDFVKKVQSVGFEAGSHAKKLTQGDLDVLIALLDSGNNSNTQQEQKENKPDHIFKNPNVLLITRDDGKKEVLVVDAHLTSSGELVVETVSQSTENSLGEGLLEFRKQLGMRLGVN